MILALILAAGEHVEGSFWEETWHILTDPAHWVAEFAAELLFLFVIHFWIMDRVAHRHEGKHNGKQGRHVKGGVE